MQPIVHVMVGILRDREGRILINQRPVGKSQAGRWEFPGGKLEAGESPEAGLRRELHEELGIVAGPMQRLVEICHDYPDFSVRLDVREVLHFGGSPHSKEQQALKWVAPDKLPHEDILEADHAVTQALRLPDTILITPDASRYSRPAFIAALRTSLEAGVRFVQLRSKSLSPHDYLSLAEQALVACRDFGARLVLNAPVEFLQHVPADGIHLDGKRLNSLHARPVPTAMWLSAACHTQGDVRRAERLAADFVLIGSVQNTPSHPGETAIGWSGFRALIEHCNAPAFALGGMTTADVAQARNNGARGIAAIRDLWRD